MCNKEVRYHRVNLASALKEKRYYASQLYKLIHYLIKVTKKTMKPKAKLRFIAPEADETRPQIKRTRTLNTVSDKINRTPNKT